MGASFLEIDFKEEGGSGDGYAKVMSEEFNRRAMELYAGTSQRSGYYYYHCGDSG